MSDLSSLVKQLKQERDRVAKQLLGMDAALVGSQQYSSEREN